MPCRRAVSGWGGVLRGVVTVSDRFGRAGQAAAPQTVTTAGALRVVMACPAAGNGCRVLTLWSRCRSRSTMTRCLPGAAMAAAWPAPARPGGRLAVAVPARVVAMTARRAAVNETCRGWTGWPARRPLRAGAAVLSAWRAPAGAGRAGSPETGPRGRRGRRPPARRRRGSARSRGTLTRDQAELTLGAGDLPARSARRARPPSGPGSPPAPRPGGPVVPEWYHVGHGDEPEARQG